MKSVHIAMDKFRDCFTQDEINQLLCSIVQPYYLDVYTYPMADGGEGSLDFFYSLGWREISVLTAGADCQERTSFFMQSPDGSTIAIELAEIAGKKHAPAALSGWDASSLGLGIALQAAATYNPKEILICLGGSASSDGGLGIFEGLGISVLNRNGIEVTHGLGGVARAQSVNTEELNQVREIFSSIDVKILVDTKAQLTGNPNAISMYGKQKGLTAIQRNRATKYMKQWAQLLQQINPGFQPTTPGTGAAGGCSAALQAIFDASIVSGADYFAYLSGITNHIDSESIVITGEGKVDDSTLTGKAIMPVINAAIANKAQLIVVAGIIEASAKSRIQAMSPQTMFFDISSFAPNKAYSLDHASEILTDNFAKELELLQ
jgi:glycerate kinase